MDNLLKLLRRLNMLLDLEKAEEIAAFTALIKIWKLEHLLLFTKGNQLRRIEDEIKAVEDQILKKQLEVYIANHSEKWELALQDSHQLALFTNNFAADHILDRSFVDIAAAVKARLEMQNDKNA